MNVPFPHPPLWLEDYNPAAKLSGNQNFLSLGVLGSIEKSFRFCQSLPVAIDNSSRVVVTAHRNRCH